MRRIKNLPYKLMITGIILAVVVLMRFFDITCFILELTGIPCPGCGMTRALLAALRFRFDEAFVWHGMFCTPDMASVSACSIASASPLSKSSMVSAA